jgi:nucleotide-binding universal stress UspA family protein
MGRDGGRAPRPVVVGVDGSSGSARALEWALYEARDRRAPVRVVTAWAWGVAASGYAASSANVMRRVEQTQEALVRAVLARFPGALPELSTELVQGDPASTLIDRSRDGVLLVLGSRGLSGAADVAVGSVADACLRHGSCPVVVVPADTEQLDSPAKLTGRDETAGTPSGLAPAVVGALGLL